MTTAIIKKETAKQILSKKAKQWLAENGFKWESGPFYHEGPIAHYWKQVDFSSENSRNEENRLTYWVLATDDGRLGFTTYIDYHDQAQESFVFGSGKELIKALKNHKPASPGTQNFEF